MRLEKTVICWSVAGALSVMAGSAVASGFALIEQSGSGLGNAFAGGAASAEDASTIFYNPAGMSRLEGKQIAIAGSMIRPSAKFSGTATPGSAPFQTPGAFTGGDAGSWALVPNAYFTMEVDPQVHIGLGINSPFGLQSEYTPNWMGRYQAIKSKLQTINLNPSISYQLNDQFSIGAGLNYQRINGELSSMTNYPAAVYAGALAAGATAAAAAATAAPFANMQGVSTLTGSDSAWGYNVGAIYNFTPLARIGVSYRSRIKYNLSGAVSFANVPALMAAALPNQAIRLAMTMPDSLSISGFHQVSDKWDFMADATWTGWSVFQQLNVVRMNGTSLTPPTPENWKDTWRVAAGASYHYSDQWTARLGVAFDQSPVADQFRTVRIPDGNRTWLSVGGQYKPGKDSALDFGYAHLFVGNVPLNQNAAANPDLVGKGYLVGSYQDSIDIVSVQYVHSF